MKQGNEQKKVKLEEIRIKLICHLNNFVEEVDEKKLWIHEDGDMLFVDWFACISFEKDQLAISFDLDCIPSTVAHIMYCLCFNNIRVEIYNDFYYSIRDQATYFDEEAFVRQQIDIEGAILSHPKAAGTAKKIRQALAEMDKRNKRLN